MFVGKEKVGANLHVTLHRYIITSVFYQMLFSKDFFFFAN